MEQDRKIKCYHFDRAHHKASGFEGILKNHFSLWMTVAFVTWKMWTRDLSKQQRCYAFSILHDERCISVSSQMLWDHVLWLNWQTFGRTLQHLDYCVFSLNSISLQAWLLSSSKHMLINECLFMPRWSARSLKEINSRSRQKKKHRWTCTGWVKGHLVRAVFIYSLLMEKRGDHSC